MLHALFALALVLAPRPAAAADTSRPTSVWRIEVARSQVVFKIRHVMSRVSGRFTDWNGTITGDSADWGGASVEVVIQSKSIDTNNDARDTHLRSADFFDTDQYPEIRFRSTAVQLAGSSLTIDGDLTIKGITHPVVLTGAVLGPNLGGDGRDRAGFEASTSINRLDYGITWNRVAEGGGMLLGDDVSIEITVAAVRQIAAAPERRLGGQ